MGVGYPFSLSLTESIKPYVFRTPLKLNVGRIPASDAEGECLQSDYGAGNSPLGTEDGPSFLRLK